MDINYINNSIKNLSEFAKEHGLKLVFRNKETNTGDFCLFIYKQPSMMKFRNRYLVGFDGYWDVPADSNVSFDNCWEAAHKYISNYKQ